MSLFFLPPLLTCMICYKKWRHCMVFCRLWIIWWKICRKSLLYTQNVPDMLSTKDMLHQIRSTLNYDLLLWCQFQYFEDLIGHTLFCSYIWFVCVASLNFPVVLVWVVLTSTAVGALIIFSLFLFPDNCLRKWSFWSFNKHMGI